MKAKIKYYWHAIKWLWLYKDEPNNRAKWRRMMREVGTEEGYGKSKNTI